jgi:CRP-like cAMP-binding protein
MNGTVSFSGLDAPFRSEAAAIQWLIRKLERLADLQDEDRIEIAGLMLRLEEVPAGRHLIREGQRPDECCLLVSGFACRHKVTADGARQIVSFHLRGDLLDIQHLLLDRADHSVQTISAGVVAWVPKQQLVRLAWTRPAIGQALWRDSLIDASIFREWVLNVGRRDGRSRIAHMLCEFATRCEAAGLGDANCFELPMTQEQIGDATGLTSVHVNRMLKVLRDEGAIARSGRQVRITDWERLRAIADFDPDYLHAAA